MTPLQLIVNAVLTILLPILIGIVYWYSRVFAQRLPEQQRAALAQYSRMAVAYVEQTQPEAVNKTELAIAFCAELFALLEPRVPKIRAIEIAVGSAQFEVSRLARASE